MLIVPFFRQNTLYKNILMALIRASMGADAPDPVLTFPTKGK